MGKAVSFKGFANDKIIKVAVASIDEVRFLSPVRPDDSIYPQAEILSITPSNSKPDRGIMRIQYRGYNQHGTEVIHFITIMMGKRKPATQ